ncbi:MAG: DUF3318 domain-containing protein [Cyanobacteria bacterium P01_A01_bin.3]
MYNSTNFDRLINYLPFEIRGDVAIEVGTDDQSKVVQPLWRFPWQDRSRFAIDMRRWDQLSADQQKIYFLREASLATEISMGNNWAALLLYPALLGAGATGFLVEMQMSDNLGIGLAGGLALVAFLLLRRSEKGQKAQISADEYAIRHASQNGYTEQQAAGLLLSAWLKIRELEGRTKSNYDYTIRQRNLEYVNAKGLTSSALAVPASSGRNSDKSDSQSRSFDGSDRAYRENSGYGDNSGYRDSDGTSGYGSPPPNYGYGEPPRSGGDYRR